RATGFSDSLLSESLEHIESESVRLAANSLVAAALKSPGIECAPGYHGAIRTFRYIVADDLLFAFIFNKASLLFYVRRPALRDVRVNRIVETFLRKSRLEFKFTNSKEFSIR